MGDRQRINDVMKALQDGTESVGRNPSEQNYRRALSDIERAGRKSNFWPWVIAGAIVAFPAFLAWESQPRVSISDLNVYHNVRRSSKKNIKMVFDLNTAHIKNRSCTAIVYFYHRNGKKVKSNRIGYRTKNGQLSTSEDFRTRYEYGKYDNFVLYVPNKYFLTGSYKAEVTAYCGNQFVGNTKRFHLQ